MEPTELSKFVPQHIKILAPGLTAVDGIFAGQPAVWISSTAQKGCMVFPPPEKKESPAEM